MMVSSENKNFIDKFALELGKSIVDAIEAQAIKDGGDDIEHVTNIRNVITVGISKWLNKKDVDHTETQAQLLGYARELFVERCKRPLEESENFFIIGEPDEPKPDWEHRAYFNYIFKNNGYPKNDSQLKKFRKIDEIPNPRGSRK